MTDIPPSWVRLDPKVHGDRVVAASRNAHADRSFPINTRVLVVSRRVRGQNVAGSELGPTCHGSWTRHSRRYGGVVYRRVF